MEKAAKWYIYRLTDRNIQEGRGDITMGQLMDEILGSVSRLLPAASVLRQPTKGTELDKEALAKRKRVLTFFEEFQPVVLAAIRDVMQPQQFLIARMNAARILHRLAEWGVEATADDFVRIITDPQEHEAVKLYALMGVGELFAKQAFTSKQGPERMERCAAAVVKFLEDACQVNEAIVSQLSPEEIEAIRWFRRAAVRALGSTRRALIVEEVEQKGPDGKPLKAAKVQAKLGERRGPIAPVLLRVMNNDRVVPDASWRERAEAAIALSLLQGQTVQPDYVAFHLGRFIGAMAAAGNNDVERKAEQWTRIAADLKTALDEAAKPPAALARSAYFKGMFKSANEALLHLFDPKQGDSQAANNLLEFLGSNPPQAKDLYNPPLAGSN
jgi:hypothetical protein